MYRILLVDDESSILKAMRRCLAEIDVTKLDGEPLVVEAFEFPDAALARCEEQDFDLVISDYRMHPMNGVEFLIRLMDVQPNVPRMIVSGFADREAIITAINEAGLTHFLEKPWNDDKLRNTVAAVLNAHAAKNARAAGSGLNRDRQVNQLERECPGITQIDLADDGGIVFDIED